VRKARSLALFSIRHRFDRGVLDSIRLYLKAKTEVNLRARTNGFYSFDTYSRESLLRAIAHFRKYPLLGETAAEFDAFQTFVSSAGAGVED
jgi:hypothetical protein